MLGNDGEGGSVPTGTGLIFSLDSVTRIFQKSYSSKIRVNDRREPGASPWVVGPRRGRRARAP
jgi:hypothetical protein